MTAKCNIITDSPCDFTKVQADAAGVPVLPFTYTENKPGGGFHGDDDLFQSVSSHDFYEMIRRGATPMTTARLRRHPRQRMTVRAKTV